MLLMQMSIFQCNQIIFVEICSLAPKYVYNEGVSDEGDGLHIDIFSVHEIKGMTEELAYHDGGEIMSTTF